MNESVKKTTKKGRKPKAVCAFNLLYNMHGTYQDQAATGSNQRTLKDMFRLNASSSSASLDAPPEFEIIDVDRDVNENSSRESDASTADVANDGILAGTSAQHTSSLRPAINTLPTEVREQTSQGQDTAARSIPEVIDATDIDSTHVGLVAVSEGHTREAPIIIESSPPPKPAPQRVPAKALWSLFERKIPTQTAAPRRVSKSKLEGLPPTFPDSDSQHVRGPQSQHTPTTSLFPFKDKGKARASTSIEDVSNLLQRRDSCRASAESILLRTPVEGVSILDPESIPPSHRTYPAISRILHGKICHHVDVQYLPWADKWRPRKAEEVLGNETRALYLRDWLVALRLHYGDASGTILPSPRRSRKRKSAKNRKPTVIRQVKKRRKTNHDDLDGFIAPDVEEDAYDYPAESEEDMEAWLSSFDDISEVSVPLSPPSSFPSSPPPEDQGIAAELPFSYEQPNFGQQIHNTILLHGPTGSGKTAAVYACAQELGWEVFEVNPGVGERNGPGLQSLIGDVGKNHLVNTPTSPVRRTKVKPKSNKFRILSDDEGISAPLPDPSPIEFTPVISAPDVKQSLILIEEVDVLYNNDGGFWPALIAIIKECRRPVILTCNDISMVPLRDLPLQATLTFEPPPVDVAVSYLQTLCDAEGHRGERKILEQLYRWTDDNHEGNASFRSQSSTASISSNAYDIRRSINQLQLGLLQRSSQANVEPHTLNPPDATPIDEQSKVLQRLYCSAETQSFADFENYHDAGHRVNVIFEDAYAASDDLLGYTILPREPFEDDQSAVSAFYQRDRTIASESRWMAQKVTGLSAAPLGMHDRLSADTAVYQSRMMSVFERCSLFKAISGESPLYLDYAPWIRFMVGIDEKVVAPSGSQAGRQTRNSRRTVDRRYLGHFLDTELEMVLATGFRMDDEGDSLFALEWHSNSTQIAVFIGTVLYSNIARKDINKYDLMERPGTALSYASPRPSKSSPALSARRLPQRSPTDMDSEAGPSAAAPSRPPDPAPPATAPPGDYQNKTPSPPAAASRHSPVTPLAPLEFLQNQRRGSITDPSLHAAGPHTHLLGSPLSSNQIPRSLRRPEPVSIQPLPTSGYRFGEASRASDTQLPHFRQLLRSPSTEGDSPVEPKSDPRGSEHKPPSSGGAGGTVDVIFYSLSTTDKDRMDVDSHPAQFHPPESAAQNRPSSEQFDYNARRPSIAGTKRKLSSDRDMSTAGNGDVDPQLVGPGVPSTDADAPVAKRRGSAFDTRIAQLSLDERRGSVDSRAGGGPQWWQERRDSTTSILSTNTPLTGYSTPSSGLPGDSPHGRPPAGIATFAWNSQGPPSLHPDQSESPQPHSQNEAGMAAAVPPHYDPMSIVPSVSYSPDRRLSVPTASTETMSTPSAAGPSRVLRQRSRPTSRARAKEQSAANNPPQSPGPAGSNVIPEDAAAQELRLQKEPGATPYSRSPELRISHKLAERKRRKEMKELFDELRDQLPADRGMKASKWEILSKAIDFILTLKQSHQDMTREIDMLRHELDAVRQGMAPFGPGPLYGHPPPMAAPYPPHAAPPGPPLPHPHAHAPPPPHLVQPPQPHPPPQPPQPQQHPLPPSSRPASSQAQYPPNGGTAPPAPPPSAPPQTNQTESSVSS
ncbi:hypothetical protein K474DRAFT_1703650 [Panus rudis PR-1116 ss-1]|nr:hypothetical protein K474DRAFT_1703650 [Panus rudis PR-1116 ss-1]